MNNELVKYIASSVVRDIRDGAVLSEPLCLELLYFPYHDTMRTLVVEADLPKLKALRASGGGLAQNLAISLLRPFVGFPDVAKYLDDLWSADNLPIAARIAVQHRMLDRAGLLEEHHRDLMTFTLTNWDEWLRLMTGYAGGPGSVLDFCRKRLSDPNFRAEKRWVYLFYAVGAEDQFAAGAFLKPFAEDESAIVASAARIALERLTRLEGHANRFSPSNKSD